jgi:hypothetical protein
VNYADYVATLLPLLRRETSGTGLQSQKAFVNLRENFARSYHLVQQEQTLPSTINTEASGGAIGGVLLQTNKRR